MLINNIETAKATATRIGKSKKECITVDGKVFIKSCNIGSWMFLVASERNELNYETGAFKGRIASIISKHRDMSGAHSGIDNIKSDHAICLNKYKADYQSRQIVEIIS